MTGLEYTDRLINDIAKTEQSRARVPDPFAQIKQVGLTGRANLEDFWSALGVWDTDAHLDILTQFTNINDRLIDHNKGDKVAISIFKRDVTKNREAIGKVFQEIIDNDKLIDITSKEPISKYLVQQLDYIHQSAR